MASIQPDRLSKTERLLSPDRPKRDLKVGQEVTALDGKYNLMSGYVTDIAKGDGLAIMHHSPDAHGPKMTAEYEMTARLNPSHEMLTATVERLQQMLQEGVQRVPGIDLQAATQAMRTMRAGGMDDQSWRVLSEAVQFALRRTLDAAGIDFERMPQHKGFDFEVASIRAIEESRDHMNPDVYRNTHQKAADALGHLLTGSKWYYETQERIGSTTV